MIKTIVMIIVVSLAVVFPLAWYYCPSDKNEIVTITSTQTLNMSKPEAWKYLQDLTLAHHYVPGIIKTEITSERKTGVGASRRVYQSEDSYLNETVTEWEQGSGFLLHLLKDNGDAPFPFSHAEFRYRLVDSGDRNTTITTSLRFKMAGGRLGQWLGKMLTSEFQSRTDQVADQLKIYYESL